LDPELRERRTSAANFATSPAVLTRLLAALPALVLSACVVSLEPAYDDADKVFDASLVGTWTPRDAAESWRCRKSDDGGYRVTYTDERRRKGEFSVQLLTIDGKRFLDFFPVETSTATNALYADHWIAAHTFAQVLSTSPALRLAILDQEWLEKRLAEKSAELAHRVVGRHVVIVASTAEIRAFLAAHTDTPGAFRSTAELRKTS
jgi:hypothetical protein